MIQEIKGDLLNMFNKLDIIVHGCNCFHKMGAGIARAISRKYPIVYEYDKKTKYGDIDKLGTIQSVPVNDKIIINAYTQFRIGKIESEIQLRYKAIESCMMFINEKYPTQLIGFPKIGCGLAGLEWEKVKSIMNVVFEERKQNTIFVYYI